MAADMVLSAISDPETWREWDALWDCAGHNSFTVQLGFREEAIVTPNPSVVDQKDTNQSAISSGTVREGFGDLAQEILPTRYKIIHIPFITFQEALDRGLQAVVGNLLNPPDIVAHARAIYGQGISERPGSQLARALSRDRNYDGGRYLLTDRQGFTREYWGSEVKRSENILQIKVHLCSRTDHPPVIDKDGSYN